MFVKTTPSLGAFTVTVIMLLAPALNSGRVQLTDPPTSTHVHVPLLAETYEVPGGRASTTFTFTASDGPLFVIASVYVMRAPAFTVPDAALAMARSACGVTGVF